MHRTGGALDEAAAVLVVAKRNLQEQTPSGSESCASTSSDRETYSVPSLSGACQEHVGRDGSQRQRHADTSE